MTSVIRTILHRFPIPELPGYESRLVRLEFPPGCVGVPHTHPVEGMGYVLEGEHLSQWKGGEEEYYKAGDTFVDRRDALHVRTENLSQTERLVILVSYVIPVDKENVVMAA